MALRGHMRILLTGASGFIGRRLAAELSHAGHQVICAVRRPTASLPPSVSHVCIDFNQAVRANDWAAALEGVDVVVNTVGIFRETPGQSFDTIHRAAPAALFEAAAATGVKHVVQLSALGA